MEGTDESERCREGPLPLSREQRKPRTLREVQAFLQLGLEATEELPELATDLLVKGEESESLVLLAGLGPNPNPFEAAELVGKALAQANLGALEDAEAARIVAQRIASAIVDGSIPPEDGLWWLLYNVRDEVEDTDFLEPLAALALEFDHLTPNESRKKRRGLEKEITAFAAGLLRSPT